MAIFSFCFVPETRGKTMQQIQNLFHSDDEAEEVFQDEEEKKETKEERKCDKVKA